MNETVIKPHKKLALNLGELKAYRELLFYFAWRDIKVRYKQTAIGASWAILQPFVSMVVFTLFFNKVVGIQSGGPVPYAVFAFLGLLFWNFFAAAFTKASNSLVDNQGVITKIYFPRLIPPLSSGVIGLIDFTVASIFLVVIMIYYGISPGLSGLVLFLPMVFLTFVTATGPGLLLAAVNVKYRDVKQALPFFIQTLLFLTPVIYPVALVPERFQWVLYLNPMTGIISVLRSTLLGLDEPRWNLFLISATVAILMFVIGICYFKAKEKEFADII